VLRSQALHSGYVDDDGGPAELVVQAVGGHHLYH